MRSDGRPGTPALNALFFAPSGHDERAGADERDLGLGHVALGDVWVRSAPPADAWTRRRGIGKDDG